MHKATVKTDESETSEDSSKESDCEETPNAFGIFLALKQNKSTKVEWKN